MISPSKKELLTKIYVFLATYLSYASFHACRTLWSYSKDSIKKDPVYGYSSEFFGLCDFTFLFVYAFSFYCFSWIGDRIDLRIFLSIGSIGLFFSFLSIFLLRLFSFSSLPLLLFLFALDGFSQSLGFPGNLSIINSYFQSPVIFAMWASTRNFGDVIGYQFGSIVENLGWNWEWGIFIAAGNVLIFWVVLITGLKTKKVDKEQKEVEQNREINNAENKEIEQFGFFKAWKIPMLPLFVLGFCVVKSSNYGILFWLAYYLKQNNLSNIASSVSQTYEIGEVMGGLTLGIINHKWNTRSIFLPFSLMLAAFFFVLFGCATGGITILYYMFIFFCGFFLGAPYIIVSSQIAAFLGQSEIIKGNRKRVSTVSGIMEGSGSFAAAFLQLVIPYFQDDLFYIFALLCVIGVGVFSIIAYKEWKFNDAKLLGNQLNSSSK